MDTITRQDVSEQIDARGLVCPMPTLRLGQAMKRVPLDAIVELWSDDPGADANMAAFARHTGHELLSAREDGKVRVFRFRRVR